MMRTIKILRIIGFVLLLCVLVTLFSMFFNSGDLTDNDISRNGKPYPKSYFTLFENKIYATVAGSGYYEVEGADVATFSPFGGYESRNLAGDKNHVYCGNQILPDLQPEETVYSGNGLYTDGTITYYCNAISEKKQRFKYFFRSHANTVFQNWSF